MKQAHFDAAKKFDEENPEVWHLFCRFAFEARFEGSGKIGAKMIWERIRWFCTVETTEDSPKLNNNYTAFYARKWCKLHPEHKDLFAIRESA